MLDRLNKPSKKNRGLKLVLLVFIVSACAPTHNSRVHVANGAAALDNQYNNPVQMLYSAAMQSSGNASITPFCTLTFVNDTTAFTAQHCVIKDGQVRQDLAVLTPQNTASLAQNVFITPSSLDVSATLDKEFEKLSQMHREFFRADSTCRDPQWATRVKTAEDIYDSMFEQLLKVDFAIVVFNPGTGESFVNGGKYYGLALKDTQSANRTTVKHIGYGNNGVELDRYEANSCLMLEKGMGGFGTRRQGTNTTLQAVKDYLKTDGSATTTDGSGKNVSTAGGDSGSAWVSCEGTNCNTFDVFGITSAGDLDPTKPGVNESLAVSLHTQISKDLMKSAVECQNQPCAAKFRGYDEVVLGKAPTTTQPTQPVAENQQDLEIKLNLTADKTEFSIDKSKDLEGIRFCSTDTLQDCTAANELKISTTRSVGQRNIFTVAERYKKYLTVIYKTKASSTLYERRVQIN